MIARDLAASALEVSPRDEGFLERFFQSIDGQDWSTLTQFLHPEVVYERPGYEPFRGRDRVMQFYRDERIIADGLHTLERVMRNGDDLVCLGSFAGTSRKGEHLAVRFADTYQLESDRVWRRRTYFYTAAV